MLKTLLTFPGVWLLSGLLFDTGYVWILAGFLAAFCPVAYLSPGWTSGAAVGRARHALSFS